MLQLILQVSLNNFGAYLSTVGNVRDGAKLLEQGINKHPRNAELRYNLGTLMFSNNFVKEAQDQLIQAQSIETKSAPILNNLALTFISTGNFIKSKELLEEALELHDNFDVANHKNFFQEKRG